jgi:hypothetical protein
MIAQTAKSSVNQTTGGANAPHTGNKTMSQAKLAVRFSRAMAQYVWPDKHEGMEQYTQEWLGAIDTRTDVGTHKYIPTKKLNEDLGLTDGSGVWGYTKYPDGSYLLMTCSDRNASWSGKPEDKATFED